MLVKKQVIVDMVEPDIHPESFYGDYQCRRNNLIVPPHYLAVFYLIVPSILVKLSKLVPQRLVAFPLFGGSYMEFKAFKLS